MRKQTEEENNPDSIQRDHLKPHKYDKNNAERNVAIKGGKRKKTSITKIPTKPVQIKFPSNRGVEGVGKRRIKIKSKWESKKRSETHQSLN